MTKTLVVILTLIVLFSCRSTYRLSQSEQKFNPYKEGDTLTFISSSGDKDSIFIVNVSKFYKKPNLSYKFFDDRRQEIYVSVRHSDPSPPDGKQRYLTNRFLTIGKQDTSSATIQMEFAAKNAWFYGHNLTLDAIAYYKKETIKVPAGTFSDVVAISSYNQEYKSRDNFIKTIYWSKSFGYIRFDLLNGTTWELINKHGR